MMPPGRLLVIVGLAVWGLYTGQWIGALLMAALIGASLAPGLRITLTARDYFRIADLTSVLFATLAVICFVRYGFRGIYPILTWLPYVLFPLVAAQAFHGSADIPRAALFASLRRRHGEADASGIDTLLPYFMGCLLAASVAADRDSAYFLVAGAALAALLLAMPSRRHRLPVRAVAIGVVLATGLAATHTAVALQQRLEDMMVYLAMQFIGTDRDPNTAITAIGSISRLKRIDSIELRIDADPVPRLPLLLLEASYTRFNHGVWSLPDTGFTTIDALPGQALWPLREASAAAATVEVSRTHPRELATVPLPIGASTVGGPDIFEVQRNDVGTVMMEMPVGPVDYRVGYGPPPPVPYRAAPDDLAIPDSYAALIGRYRDALGLAGADPAAAAAAVRRFFATEFSYTLEPRRRYGARYPLREFLDSHRSGHCEYFATATVLLLRSAGIPARYAVGYLVQEYSDFERRWIARTRHRHAWALAYVDGRWLPVDATPPAWFDIEDRAAPVWQGLLDTVNWVLYRIKRLGRGTGEDSGTLAPAALTALVAALAVLVYRRRRRAHGAAPARAAASAAPRGADSELFTVMKQLAAMHPPADGEPLRRWFRRCIGDRDAEADRAVTLHYRYRFDPTGLSPAEREELARLAGLLGRRLAAADFD